MASVITLKGIDQALSDLNYRNKNALKYRLVHTIRQFYESEDLVESMQGIDTDELIKVLWNTGDDPGAIKNRRKNLNSIKSSVNTDLQKLYNEGKNLEGITIGPTNIYILSDEAKDNVLKAFRSRVELEGIVTLSQITKILNIVNEILSNPEAIADAEREEGLRKLDQLKKLLQGLPEEVGDPEEEVEDDADIVEDAEPFEVVVTEEELVLDELQGAEDTEELDEEEVIEDLEDVGVDDAIEGAEVEEAPEQGDAVKGAGETDISVVNLGEEYSDGSYEEDDEIKKARLLAEEFNNLIGAMDRFYNQYLLIPEGEYIVGSKRPKKDEKPEQKVHLSPFYMGKLPVTNALFEIFVEKTGYRTTAEKLGYGTVYYGRFRKTIDEKTGLKKLTWNSSLISKAVEGACWHQPLGQGSTLHNKRNHPVVQVSLEDAMAFAAWTGKRLPTEDEWEAASRTTHGYVFPWGKDWKNDSCNIEESHIGDTTPVDKYIELANDFVIADTMGNVLDWTLDRSEPPSYRKNGLKYYIVKGGSWISGNDIRLFSRFKSEPESHSNILGFRCVAY